MWILPGKFISNDYERLSQKKISFLKVRYCQTPLNERDIFLDIGEDAPVFTFRTVSVFPRGLSLSLETSG